MADKIERIEHIDLGATCLKLTKLPANAVILASVALYFEDDAKLQAWVKIWSNLSVLCPDVIRRQVTCNQLAVEIAQLVDPDSYYTDLQRLEWLKTNIRRRSGQSAIEMWDARQTLWVRLSDVELNNIYPFYVRGNVPDRQVGLEFVQVLETLASPSDEDPIVRRVLEQRTICRPVQ